MRTRRLFSAHSSVTSQKLRSTIIFSFSFSANYYNKCYALLSPTFDFEKLQTYREVVRIRLGLSTVTACPI